MLSRPETVLVSADEAGCLSFRHISKGNNSQWKVEKSTEAPTNEPIARLLVNASRDQAFVVSTQSVSLWTTSGKRISHIAFSTPLSVLPHPTKPDSHIDLTHSPPRVLSWTTTADEGNSARQQLTTSFDSSLSVPASSIVSNSSFVVVLRRNPGHSAPASLECWALPASGAGTFPASALPFSHRLASRIEQLIALMGPSRLIFLDTELWLCSVDLMAGCDTAGEPRGMQRYFFVPSEWRGAMGKVLLQFNEMNREFVVAVGSGIVVAKHGLDAVTK